jgi:hypothetical protein
MEEWPVPEWNSFFLLVKKIRQKAALAIQLQEAAQPISTVNTICSVAAFLPFE